MSPPPRTDTHTHIYSCSLSPGRRWREIYGVLVPPALAVSSFTPLATRLASQRSRTPRGPASDATAARSPACLAGGAENRRRGSMAVAFQHHILHIQASVLLHFPCRAFCRYCVIETARTSLSVSLEIKQGATVTLFESPERQPVIFAICHCVVPLTVIPEWPLHTAPLCLGLVMLSAGVPRVQRVPSEAWPLSLWHGVRALCGRKKSK